MKQLKRSLQLATKNAGFTLMELMVYMAILGVIVLVAGEAFSNSTKFRVRTNNMVKATQLAENVAMLFKDDVSQMGAKSSLENVKSGGNSDEFNTEHIKSVYMSDTDSSSYELIGDNNLRFRRLRYNANGKFEAVEEVAWYMDGDTLKRWCKIVEKKSGVSDEPCAPKGDGTPSDEFVTRMATSAQFSVTAGLPRAISDSSEFPFPKESEGFDLAPRIGEANYNYMIENVIVSGRSVMLTGFHSNYDYKNGKPLENSKERQQLYMMEATPSSSSSGDATAPSISKWKSCHGFNFKPGIVYELSFKVPFSGVEDDPNKMQMFVPGTDHLSVGFRTRVGKNIPELEDFLFYPPTSENAPEERVMRFSVPNGVSNACMAFTFACYSPLAANGSLTLEDIVIKEVAGETYDFTTETIETKDKKNVKAFKLDLVVKRGGKIGDHGGETGNVNIVVPTPSNGPRG